MNPPNTKVLSMRPAPLLTKYYSGKTYRRFTIFSRNKGFLYIGKNTHKIGLLTEALGTGSHTENVKTAMAELKLATEKGEMPGIIIISAEETDELALRKLNNFVSANNAFCASTPFILDVCGLTEEEIKKYSCFQFLDEMLVLHEQGITKFISQVRFLEEVKRHPFHTVDDDDIETSGELSFDSRALLKRTVDIVVSILAIIVLSPVFLLIALAIKLESAGPVFYVSRRAGRGYKVFKFYKFRTMVLDADKQVDELYHLNQYTANNENGPVFFKVINDPRLTRVGAFLRTTSMDELPQFFNVLRGDMSLVGNRPLPLDEAAALTTDNWAPRFMAPAGMTGLWQIRKKHESKMSVERRIKLDIHYAHKRNFIYDLWIIANTPSALIQKPNT